MPPLLELPVHTASVCMFATSAKANSQVKTTLHASSATSHMSQVHRVFHDVAALVLRRRQTLSSSSDSETPPLQAALVPAEFPAHDIVVDGSGKRYLKRNLDHYRQADRAASLFRVS